MSLSNFQTTLGHKAPQEHSGRCGHPAPVRCFLEMEASLPCLAGCSPLLCHKALTLYSEYELLLILQYPAQVPLPRYGGSASSTEQNPLPRLLPSQPYYSWYRLMICSLRTLILCAWLSPLTWKDPQENIGVSIPCQTKCLGIKEICASAWPLSSSLTRQRVFGRAYLQWVPSTGKEEGEGDGERRSNELKATMKTTTTTKQEHFKCPYLGKIL